MQLALLWLNTKNEVERDLYESLYEQVVKKREMMEDALAAKIANAVGKLFG